jgi:membrane-bound inhibitor of C-type lysozyme
MAKKLSILFVLLLPIQVFAAETYSYVCNGTQIKAAFPDEGEKAILYYSGKLYLLKSVVSGSGARYLGDGWELWDHHGELYLTQLNKEQVAKDEVPMAQQITCKETKSVS